MPLRDDLLNPIAGDSPSGADIRRDFKLSLYDKIKEARRQDDDLPQGEWQHERKAANYPLVVNVAQEGLATSSKDLQLAVWLTEAMLHTEGYSGLRQGIALCHGLVAQFWDTLYPAVEDGDLELRAAPLDWLGTSLEIPLKKRPLVRDGYDWFKFKESKLVGYEEHAQTDNERKKRAKMLAEGKLAPEVFDKAFSETPKAFYLQSEKDLDGCLDSMTAFDQLCEEKFGKAGPSFGNLKKALDDVRHTVHMLLEKKRETEPDPVIETPAEDAAAAIASEGQSAASGLRGAPGIIISIATSSEPLDRREAIIAVAQAAAFLRKREPHSPAPYLMMRGLRWGELRAAFQLPDSGLLEAPPTELRQHIKRLALGHQWGDLLETAENAMSLPCSRAWLDLQRMVVAACTALGGKYETIAVAIRSELRTLLSDLPELLDANLLDDTPAANAETRAWLKELLENPDLESQPQADGTPAPARDNHHQGLSWLQRAADPHLLAQQLLKGGEPEKAYEVMRKEIARQQSGRGRFLRTMQLVQLCVEAGNDAIAQPLIDDLAAAIETHKLDDWEDNEMVAAALATVMRISKKVQENAGERQKLFERICRLDPVRALSTG
ncbi:MAG TPA: type VI secretion system protein TssA [Terriglobales bacterium]